MTQHLRLLLGAIIITIYAAPVQAESFKQAEKLYASADYFAAISELQPLAKADNADTNNLLGETYLYGLGIQTNIAKAKRLFESGARTDHLASLNNLDSIHNAEYKLELKTIEPLATSGNAAAQNDMEGKMNLARSYNFGLGTEQDFIKAETGYLANAQAGYVDSMFSLGTMHFAQITQEADEAGYGHATAAAMVSRLAMKLGGDLDNGEALYTQYTNTFSVAQ
jgi:TPR repeat protein